MLHRSGEKIDLLSELVIIGQYTIQGDRVFGAGESEYHNPWSNEREERFVLDMLGQVAGIVIDISHSGKRSGYGHGRRIITMANSDGSLIYQRTVIDYCNGPGYGCSYDHGPWYTYGYYRGDACPDNDLVAALECKKTLEQRFSF